MGKMYEGLHEMVTYIMFLSRPQGRRHDTQEYTEIRRDTQGCAGVHNYAGQSCIPPAWVLTKLNSSYCDNDCVRFGLCMRCRVHQVLRDACVVPEWCMLMPA